MLVEMPRSRSRLQNSSREIPAAVSSSSTGYRCRGVDAALARVSRQAQRQIRQAGVVAARRSATRRWCMRCSRAS